MLGGEHKKERFSERLENAQNQPKNRGYLPGTVAMSSGYTPATLEGNWYEERADASFHDGTAVLPRANERCWMTTYRDMVGTSKSARRADFINFDQGVMVEIVDRTRSSYPGHQPHLDPQWKTTLNETFKTTTRETYVNHLVEMRSASVKGGQVALLPVCPVKVHGTGSTPAAQARGVLQRLRQQLHKSMPGRTALPGNVIRTLRHALQESCTDKDSGEINAAELCEGLEAVGLEVSLTECDAVISGFDSRGRGGTALIDTVIAELRGSVNGRREQLIRGVYDLLESICNRSDGYGILRSRDLVRLIDAKYLPYMADRLLSVDEARALFRDQLDLRTGDETYISFEVFLRYFSDAAFEIDSENDYELWMRNCWHLSGGQDKSANTSCRRLEVLHHNGRVTKEEVVNDLDISGSGDIVAQRIIENLHHQGIKDVKSFRVL
ncbi:unnamed protein product [Phytomonas sp. EM1]|nr:unnamed protein product [Phytomonas sp. EM1]|eukprot:CCW60818.1 unnamed protein product [Phytomonas sp. isolate EM1]